MSRPSRALSISGAILRHHNQLTPLFPLCHHHRTLFERFLGRKERSSRDAIDPKRPISKPKRKDRTQEPEDKMNSGGLAPSILDDEIRLRIEERRKEQRKRGDDKGLEGRPGRPEIQNPRDMKPTRKNPDPQKRLKWERKKVRQSVLNRFRMTRSEKLLRSERFSLSTSPKIKTSIKKLGPLARQIAGKPLAEAMIQMRFSKKRAAADVLKHLEYARNQAIVQREMGIGKPVRPVRRPHVKGEEKSKEGSEDRIIIEDKKGKQREISDPSAIYIDQAWVGRATPDYGTDFRARGRAHRLTLPHTTVSVLLKEEATRIREAKEREQKRLNKKVWVPLPDRPVTAQRQYPLW